MAKATSIRSPVAVQVTSKKEIFQDYYWWRYHSIMCLLIIVPIFLRRIYVYVLFYLKYKIDFPPMKHGFWNHNEDGCNQWHIRLSSLCCPKAWKNFFFKDVWQENIKNKFFFINTTKKCLLENTTNYLYSTEAFA